MFNNIRKEINHHKSSVDWLSVAHSVLLLPDIVYKLIPNSALTWALRSEIIMNFFNTFLGRM